MSSEPTVKPDDITPEEWNEAHHWLRRRRFDLTGALAAQNALRDQRVAAEALDRLLKLYRPGVGQGNFMGDVSARGGNEMIVRVAVALDLADEATVRARFTEMDAAAFELTEKAIARAEGARDEYPEIEGSLAVAREFVEAKRRGEGGAR